MSESATEKRHPWPSCSTVKLPSESESNIEGAKKLKEKLGKFNPKLFNQFLDNLYLCGGCMK